MYKALCCQITHSEINGTTNPWVGHNNLTEQTLQNAKLLRDHSLRGHSLEPENGPMVLYSHCLGQTSIWEQDGYMVFRYSGKKSFKKKSKPETVKETGP